MAGLLGWPWFYWHLKSRGQGESFRPRLGLELPDGPPPGYPRIWLHGVSVGEILAAVPLARELRNLLPEAALIVTTGTETGQSLARKHFLPGRPGLLLSPGHPLGGAALPGAAATPSWSLPWNRKSGLISLS